MRSHAGGAVAQIHIQAGDNWVGRKSPSLRREGIGEGVEFSSVTTPSPSPSRQGRGDPYRPLTRFLRFVDMGNAPGAWNEVAPGSKSNIHSASFTQQEPTRKALAGQLLIRFLFVEFALEVEACGGWRAFSGRWIICSAPGRSRTPPTTTAKWGRASGGRQRLFSISSHLCPARHQAPDKRLEEGFLGAAGGEYRPGLSRRTLRAGRERTSPTDLSAGRHLRGPYPDVPEGAYRRSVDIPVYREPEFIHHLGSFEEAQVSADGALPVFERYSAFISDCV